VVHKADPSYASNVKGDCVLFMHNEILDTEYHEHFLMDMVSVYNHSSLSCFYLKSHSEHCSVSSIV
jgi:hypothetical protein